MRTRRIFGLRAVILAMMLLAMITSAFAAGSNPTELSGTRYIECPDCGTLGVVLSDEGEAVPCETCADSGDRKSVV